RIQEVRMKLVGGDQSAVDARVRDVDCKGGVRRKTMRCKPCNIARAARRGMVGGQLPRDDLRRAFVEQLRRGPGLDVNNVRQSDEIGHPACINPDSQRCEVCHTIRIDHHRRSNSSRLPDLGIISSVTFGAPQRKLDRDGYLTRVSSYGSQSRMKLVAVKERTLPLNEPFPASLGALVARRQPSQRVLITADQVRIVGNISHKLESARL